MNAYIQSSCGHSWIQCPYCSWNLAIDWMKKEKLVSLLTAGGSSPIDDFVKNELAKNDNIRKRAFALAYAHIKESH